MSYSYDYVFKLLIIGDSSCGKSSILLKYLENKFSETSGPTIGIEYGTQIIDCLDKKIKLQIWDVAGQERYRTVVQSYYRNTAGIMLIYDITNKNSFDHLDYWLNEMMNANNLDKNRQNSEEEAQLFAKNHNINLIYETSAKTGENINIIFKTLAEEIYNQVKDNGPIYTGVTIKNLNLDYLKKPSNCCFS